MLIVIAIGVAVLLAAIATWLWISAYTRVEPGQALIVNTTRGVRVTFTSAVVLPIIHRAEVMDITLKTIEIYRSGSEGLICKDNIRADIKVSFFVRVNPTQEDIMKVARSIGVARASNVKNLEELFAAKFSEALKTVGKRFDFVALYQQRDAFKEQIFDIIGRDLNGFSLDDVAVDQLEQTPIDMLDPQNILDAQGIQKIREITNGANVISNRLLGERRKRLASGEEVEEPTRDGPGLFFEPPKPVDYEALLPLPKQHNNLSFSRLELVNEHLSVTSKDGSPLAALLLSEPWNAMLSRQSQPDDLIHLELRQSRPGIKLSVAFSAKTEALLDSAGTIAAANLPELHQHAIEVPGPELATLLAHLRFVMQRDGRENWGR